MNFAGAIVNEDDESEWQIINDRLSDCSSDRYKLPFRAFAYVAGCNRKRPHLRTAGTIVPNGRLRASAMEIVFGAGGAEINGPVIVVVSSITIVSI